MKKYIILATFLAGLPALAQHKQASKNKTVFSRINTGAPKPQKAIKEYTIYFKGFWVIIFDEATDELGNHMLIGRIKALEKDARKRSPFINKAIDFSDISDDDRYVVISTDKNYKPIKISSTFSPQAISYNAELKKFIVGSNTYGFKDSKDVFVHGWQSMITVLDLEQYGTTYAIKNDYSCYLKDMIIEEDKIYVLMASEEIRDYQKLEVITVDLNKFHDDKEEFFPKVLDQISHVISVNHNKGKVDISGISKVGSDYYFSASSLNHFDMIYKTYIYKFDGRTLEEQTAFKYFNDRIYRDAKLVKYNGFYNDSSNNPVFLTQRIGHKEMNLTKTNTGFDIKKNIKIKLFDYIESAKMVVLTNDNIVVLSLNENNRWEYYVYNSDLELTKKISSNLSENYYPGKLKILNDHTVECFFYDTKKSNGAVVQYADVN